MISAMRGWGSAAGWRTGCAGWAACVQWATPLLLWKAPGSRICGWSATTAMWTGRRWWSGLARRSAVTWHRWWIELAAMGRARITTETDDGTLVWTDVCGGAAADGVRDDQRAFP